jgi:hypothetical protein
MWGTLCMILLVPHDIVIWTDLWIVGYKMERKE